MAELPVTEFRIKYISVAVAAVALIAILLFPIINDPGPNRALAILAVAAILWVTEAIPLAMTALLIPILASLLGLLEVQQSFAQFANPVIFLFMGGFVLAGALSAHALDKLMAQKFMSMAGGNFFRSAMLLMLATAILASWIGNTSVTAMMLPMGLGLLAVANRSSTCPESKFIMLGIAYSANIGGVITVIGTPPNAIGAAILDFSFSKWITYGLPVFLVCFPLMILAMTLYFKPDRKLTVTALPVRARMDFNAKKLIAIFFLIVILWMLEGFLAPRLGITSGFSALVALFCVMLIVMSNLMNWPDVISSIRWDILLLFGGGLTLGVILEQSGLGAILIEKILTVRDAVPALVFLWLIIIFSIIMTEFMSNTASAALILPMLYTLATYSGADPALIVLPATIAASFGFMLPVGTPPNAMVFATGYIPQKEMMKIGLIINVLLSIVLTVMFYYVF